MAWRASRFPAVSFSFDSGAIANNATTEAGFTATSIATGVLAAGGHVFNATVATNANYIGATSAPEPFTVDKDGSSTATELHTASEAVIPLNSAVPLLTNVHDKATVTSANTSTRHGTVTFTFFANGTCTGPGMGKGTVGGRGVAHPSQASGALGPGDYAFQATYNGDNNFTGSTSDCEPFVVNTEGTSTLTQLHNNANEDVIPLDSSVALGTNVHDKATVLDSKPRPTRRVM